VPPPTVTALVPVHDGEAFLREALESALTQDWPPEALDVVVVDDGSGDGSAAVAEAVAAEHPGRVTVLRQANAGTAAAVDAARAAACGELLALLDADDAWPRGKLAAQVPALLGAGAGLLYGDMTVVDAAGATVRDSWLELVWDGEPPSGEHCFGALLAANAATASSILLRADLARTLGPIPPAVRSADWWLALAAARRGPIAYLPEPRTRYRVHDGNLGLGTEGPVLGRAHVRRALVQRGFLRTVAPGECTPLELATAWNAFERNVGEALRHLGDPFAEVVEVDDADRAAADRELARDEFFAAVRGLAADPWRPGGHAVLEATWERVAP
jgi:hypothetical protein